MVDSKLSARTNKEILILLSSQIEGLEKELSRLCKVIETKANSKETDEVADKVDILWDWRNRVIGMAIGAGALSGGVASLIMEALARL